MDVAVKGGCGGYPRGSFRRATTIHLADDWRARYDHRPRHAFCVLLANVTTYLIWVVTTEKFRDSSHP